MSKIPNFRNSNHKFAVCLHNYQQFQFGEFCIEKLKESRRSYNNLPKADVHCIYLAYNFQNNIAFLSLKIELFLANSVEPDKMKHYVAFHLGTHCLQKYPLRGLWSAKGYW